MNLNIQKTINFAALKHDGQMHKRTDIPYIVQPMCLRKLRGLIILTSQWEGFFS